MKRQICLVVLTLTLVLPAGVVFAESGQPEQKQPESCKQDVKKFCSHITKAGDSIKCLKEHESELSKPCKADLAQWMEQQLKGQLPKVPSPLGK